MLVSAESGECHAACSMQRCREVKMSELSCDTPFIGQIETHDLVRYLAGHLLVSSLSQPGRPEAISLLGALSAPASPAPPSSPHHPLDLPVPF